MRPELHIGRPFPEHERRRWQDPEAILSGIGLGPGLSFIDIGCGRGFFALPAARIIGRKGKVYGVDANAEFVAGLKEQAKGEGLGNLYLTAGRAEETILCKQCGDIVFIGMALHDFQNPSKVLENARGMIRSSGRLVDLDWKKEPTEFGPPMKIRFSVETAVDLIERAGFAVETTRDSGPYHYLVIARPQL